MEQALKKRLDKFILGHSCDLPGCKDVLVLDGNMKTCRTVCSVNKVTRVMFKSLEGHTALTGK